jgi:1,4-alpha-glucan branching enzyme
MYGIFKEDPALKAHEGQIMQRIREYRGWKKSLEDNEGGLVNFATGYKQFGFHRDTEGKKWTFTEWLPKAKQVFLVGDFNGWQNTHPLKASEFGRWTIDLPDKPDGSWAIPHKTQHRIRVEGEHGTFDRVPAWTKLAWQDKTTNLFNGVFWEPQTSQRYVFKNQRPPRPENLKIYEAHVGMSSVDPKVATYLEFKDNVLPRIKRLGYNAVQLMAVAEHAHYGSFGYHVTSFYAPASRSGTPEMLKEMIDAAHGHGLTVLMDLVHAHCSSNTMDGVAAMDGTDHCYTHGGAKGKQEQWDSSLFHYTKHEVLRFLLSNCRWWLEEYGFDGFRFDGVTSMLYNSHGIGKGYSGGYHEYFGMDADIEAHVYLMLANDLIHRLLPTSGITVAEDVSGMPTLCRPVRDGGFGFDYRLSMAVPDMWIKLLKETPDDCWQMGHITHTLQNRRWKEPCIAYAESHDQAIVGDKTTAFWLMDAEMYTHMSITTPSMIVDRGLALHKMIRILTLGLGGEGYLNFMGNEFGHPEWVDFPTELNGWSYQHCRRRFDLPAEDHLKYKFFEAFDEVMQACENRFKFVASEHQYCSLKNEGDKVIAFERGDCLFVFNFHPTNSYTDYRVGHPWKEGMKVVLDSDEGRFGGHQRLEWGHANAAPPGQASDNRYCSCQMYLPCRTMQVLVRESVLKGGVTVRLTDGAWELPAETLFIVAISPETGKEASPLPFQKDGSGLYINFGLPCLTFKAFWKLADGSRKELPAAPEKFQAYFPGVYTLDGIGNLACIGGADAKIPALGDAPPPGCTRAADDTTPMEPEIVMKRSLTPTLLGPSELPEDSGLEADNWPQYISVKKERANSAVSERAKSKQEKVEEPKDLPEPDTTSTQPSPVTKNLPSQDISETNSACSEGFSRVYSLSALDSLLNDHTGLEFGEERNQLRKGMNDATQDAPERYPARHLDTPVVIVSSEVNPWSKSGGLGMVAGSYGYEFAIRGHRTMVVSPMYAEYQDCTWAGKAQIWLEGREHEVQYFYQRIDYGDGKGTDYIFVNHISYHRPAGLYWDPKEGREYGDNLFRFALLSLASLEAPLILNLQGSTYGQNVLFIANDWQAGLVPNYIHYKYRRHNTYCGARCIFVIHNLGYQGKYMLSKFPLDSFLGLPTDAIDTLQGEDLNLGTDCINLLAAAVKISDRVLTVSPNYAVEIQTPEGGQGLHGLLQAKGAHLRLAGILNGISDEWNPKTDPHIPVNYSLADFEEGKAKCKVDFQRKLGLNEDPNAALVGFCARLCYQKGVQLVTAIVPWLMHDTGNGVNGHVQLVMMGKGDLKYADEIRNAEQSHKGRICGFVGFDPRIEHQMMAACDFYLMPSQYEPCGLPQMYAEQYGTLPIVHETGGLKDSVRGLWDEARDKDTATGFLFCGFDENPLKERMYQALETFHHKRDIFRQMQLNCLRCNNYWPQAIDEYEKHIDWTLEAEPSS